MATSKKKSLATRWYDGDSPFEELDPAEQVAHTIVQQYRDLAPSVERIMSAEELTEPQRHVAVTLFQTSLDEVGDPNRHPATAIETARATAD